MPRIPELLRPRRGESPGVTASVPDAPSSAPSRWAALLAPVAPGDPADAVTPYFDFVLEHLTPRRARLLLALRDGPGCTPGGSAYHAATLEPTGIGAPVSALARQLRQEADVTLVTLLEEFAVLGLAVRRPSATEPRWILSALGARFLAYCTTPAEATR